MMIKKIFVLLTLLLAINLFALEENQIKEFMNKNINAVTQMLKNKKVDKEALSKKIFKIFDPIFDYKLMSILSIGGNVWRDLDAKQREEFTKEFTNRLKNSYKDKLDAYNGEVFIMKKLEKVQPNRIHLVTELAGKKDKYDITYKFYRAKNHEWYIYDVNVLGVSIVQTYRAQFSDELKKESFDELLKKLATKH